jgi:hypothetical protein
MPFGLCNAPATFQRCMSAIFHGFCEEIVEVFMDDFSVYGTSFDNCLHNLDKVLQRCEETNLVLNWEKCHFMVNERIVLGHKISCQHLLLLVGFDTLIYRKYYDTSPILVGHQAWNFICVPLNALVNIMLLVLLLIRKYVMLLHKELFYYSL